MQQKTTSPRPGVTLLEVLITIFIMGIGMLALLVLFPLGAVNMARALRDDRAATSAAMAEDVAVVQDLRHDPVILPAFLTPYGGIGDSNGDGAPDNDLNNPAPWNGPSHPVYVDPYGFLLPGGNVPFGARSLPGPTLVTPGIPRVSPGFLGASPALSVHRWFSLPDDIGYFDNGLPDNSAGFVDRGGDYTWAYLVRRPRASAEALVDMKVVVYYRRSLDLLEGENVYAVVAGTGLANTNAVTITWPAGQEAPGIRVGRWILDTTLTTLTDPTLPAGSNQRLVVSGEFYRVVNWAEGGANQLVLELQSDLKSDVNTVVFMENVIEVFDKTTGTQP